jgi:hypothetical protein
MCFKIIQGTYKPKKVSLPKFYISCLQQTILSLLSYSHNIESGIPQDCTKQYCFGKIEKGQSTW